MTQCGYMKSVEHIGIAVKDLQSSIALFTKLLGTECYKTEIVESEGVTTAFFKTGETKIELLEATNEDSPVARFIGKRGEGVHHVAFEVEDIGSAMKKLSEEGFQLLSNEPTRGADNKLVCFIHPKSAGGVLVELCQTIRE